MGTARLQVDLPNRGDGTVLHREGVEEGLLRLLRGLRRLLLVGLLRLRFALRGGSEVISGGGGGGAPC